MGHMENIRHNKENRSLKYVNPARKGRKVIKSNDGC